MRAPRRYTRPSLHAPRDACISFARAQEMRAPPTCARPRHTRATAFCTRAQDIPAHFLFACAPKMAAPSAKMHAPPPATRDAKMRAFEQLRKVRLSLVASVLLATFSPTIRRSVKGGDWL